MTKATSWFDVYFVNYKSSRSFRQICGSFLESQQFNNFCKLGFQFFLISRSCYFPLIHYVFVFSALPTLGIVRKPILATTWASSIENVHHMKKVELTNCFSSKKALYNVYILFSLSTMIFYTQYEFIFFTVSEGTGTVTYHHSAKLFPQGCQENSSRISIFEQVLNIEGRHIIDINQVCSSIFL